MLYDQTKEKYTRNACGIYAALHYFKFEYGIEFEHNGTIIKLCEYLDRMGVWFQKWGLEANIAYPVLIKYIEYKTGFKLKIVKININRIDKDKGYVIGFKNASRLYLKLAKDANLTKEDIRAIKAHKSAYGHFLFWKREIAIDSLGGYSYNFSLENLRYARGLDLFYGSCRRFIPRDERTRKAQQYLIKEAKRRDHFIAYEEFMLMDFK